MVRAIGADELAHRLEQAVHEDVRILASEGEPEASALRRHDDEREVVVDCCAVIVGSVLLDGVG